MKKKKLHRRRKNSSASLASRPVFSFNMLKEGFMKDIFNLSDTLHEKCHSFKTFIVAHPQKLLRDLDYSKCNHGDILSCHL